MLGVDLDTVRLVLGLVDVRNELDVNQVNRVRCLELLLDPPWLGVVVVRVVVDVIDVVVILDEVLEDIVVRVVEVLAIESMFLEVRAIEFTNPLVDDFVIDCFGLNLFVRLLDVR